jgi:RecA/RadA recombinase
MKTAIFLKPVQMWLDTRSKYLNGVLGSRKLGIPAGKMFEIRGRAHAGKTSLVMFLAALAQSVFNAFVIWIDLENSLTNEREGSEFYNSWAAKFELDTSEENFYRVYPKVLISQKLRKKGKKTLSRKGEIYIQAAESLFDETEIVMKTVKMKWPDRPIFVALDSIANIQTAMSAGTHEEKNMRTALDRAIFLSGALPKWQTLVYNFSAWMFFINQVRDKQGFVLGDPEYSPGGKAAEHNDHVIAKMRPYKGGIVRDEDGNVTGARGTITNVKNKAGGGSKMGMKCGYSANFLRRGSKMWKFKPFEETKREK